MKISLEGKLAGLLCLAVLTGALSAVWIGRYVEQSLIVLAMVLVLALIPILWAARAAARPVRRLLRALSGAVASYRDSDFSLSLRVDRRDELGELMTAHNELGRALREQRLNLVQRELLLDTVTQNSPVALVLVDPHARVVYANIAARHLLNEGRGLVGLDFSDLLQRAPESLRVAAGGFRDTLFSADMDGVEETFHLSQRSFLLQGRPHRLYLLKRLTRELSRQEVATWKKLIRVISHELNNSLGPIASLAHSGEEFARRADTANVGAVFAAIGERAAHLHQFISGYATFAKLPSPRPERIDWREFTDELVHTHPFTLGAALPQRSGWFDRSQIEHALINLLKNAHEAGGRDDAVELLVTHVNAEQRIEVRDRGPGMSETVLAHALLPFYSTKRSGTGLGLALVREICEAHGGRISLLNRQEGGLTVTLMLPLPEADGVPVASNPTPT